MKQIGEKYMSSINCQTEYKKIKEIADGIKGSGDYISSPLLPVCPIMEYDFDTPMELQRELRGIWDKMGKEKMQEFLPVIAVAAFKNKGIKLNVEISPFNYEF